MCGYGPDGGGFFTRMGKLNLFLLAGLLLWLGACAGLPVRHNALEVTIEPDTVYPGVVVSILVLAPPGTREVKGRLDFPGSPAVPLKKADDGVTWTFSTQIPIDAVWQPGRYRALVTGIAADGAELRGEGWIVAQ